MENIVRIAIAEQRAMVQERNSIHAENAKLRRKLRRMGVPMSTLDRVRRQSRREAGL